MIRAAVHGDIPSIVEMGLRFFQDAGMPDVAEWDEASFAGFLEHLIDKTLDGELLVADLGDQNVGMAAFLCFPSYFNADLKAAQELFWFIVPEHRVGIGMEMLTAMETVAKARGAQLFIMGAIAGLRHEALSRVYRMRGYNEGERTFMKRLDR